ncbi:uncharacterized protein LOC144911567 [Branchiostoma floridae x Branchiostoma belcheri]
MESLPEFTEDMRQRPRTVAVGIRDWGEPGPPSMLFDRAARAHSCRAPWAQDRTTVRDMELSYIWSSMSLTRPPSSTFGGPPPTRAMAGGRRLSRLSKLSSSSVMKPKTPSKLLYESDATTTSEAGKVYWPRGLAVSQTGDIFVADTANHRIQVYTPCAIHKASFGSFGTGTGQFDQPSAVAMCGDRHIAVADMKNRRVQIMSESGRTKCVFPTQWEPHSIVCDPDRNVIVANSNNEIEVYFPDGELYTTFKVNEGLPYRSYQWPLFVTQNTRNEIVVSDPVTQLVKFYDYDGDLQSEFRPTVRQGVGVRVVPRGIFCDRVDNIFLVDGLNHTVNYYSDNGWHLEQMLTSAHELGTPQAVALTPEKHLVVTECSVNGSHCVKIFRGFSCDCHKSRPGSVKRKSAGLMQPVKSAPAAMISMGISAIRE